jgi:hypothetical protein
MQIGIETSMTTGERIPGAANPGRPTVKKMGMNHGRLRVAMTQSGILEV